MNTNGSQEGTVVQERCKRVTGQFPWVPPHQRLDRFGKLMPPRRPELRRPLYRLEREGSELYFVNDSAEVLSSVSSECAAMLAMGDDELGQVPVDCSQTQLCYQDVQPGEAVKVDEFDAIADADFFIQTELKVESAARGALRFRAYGQRGGCAGDVVLLWDSGEAGKDVVMVREMVG